MDEDEEDDDDIEEDFWYWFTVDHAIQDRLEEDLFKED